MTRIEKNINLGIIGRSNTEFSQLADLGKERVKKNMYIMAYYDASGFLPSLFTLGIFPKWTLLNESIYLICHEINVGCYYGRDPTRDLMTTAS